MFTSTDVHQAHEADPPEADPAALPEGVPEPRSGQSWSDFIIEVADGFGVLPRVDLLDQTARTRAAAKVVEEARNRLEDTGPSRVTEAILRADAIWREWADPTIDRLVPPYRPAGVVKLLATLLAQVADDPDRDLTSFEKSFVAIWAPRVAEVLAEADAAHGRLRQRLREAAEAGIQAPHVQAALGHGESGYRERAIADHQRRFGVPEGTMP